MDAVGVVLYKGKYAHKLLNYFNHPDRIDYRDYIESTKGRFERIFIPNIDSFKLITDEDPNKNCFYMKLSSKHMVRLKWFYNVCWEHGVNLENVEYSLTDYESYWLSNTDNNLIEDLSSSTIKRIHMSLEDLMREEEL